MTQVSYRIVEHDGGWAYKLGEVFSETFLTHAAALEAAKKAAAEQRVPGRTEAIEYEDRDGKWHSELSRGDDRPETEVVDEAVDTFEAGADSGEASGAEPRLPFSRASSRRSA
jgi:hypothetical protein